jgi:hypothetical protein
VFHCETLATCSSPPEKVGISQFNNLPLAVLVQSLLWESMATPKNPAAIWPVWQRLYALYGAIARELVIEWKPCPELEQPLDSPPTEVISETGKWFAQMDGRIQVQHLRQFAQTSALMTEEALKDFLNHYLHKQPRTAPDRDKVDFLLVQLFSQKAPPHASDADLSIRAVAKILEPVLGPLEVSAPAFLKPLNDLIQEAGRTKTLKALFTSRLIERGRDVKAKCGDHFFDPLSLAAFARFGFLIRRTFFRLMHQDLNAILDGLRELEAKGVTTLDCRKAQFAADEPVARLRMICQSWRVMFQAEYSSGQPLCLLVDLRTAVETALQTTKMGGSRTAAAAAGAGSANKSITTKFPPTAATRSASVADPKTGRQK